MTFQPVPNQTILIEGNSYRFVEHPAASWMAYQQDGRRAEVWQLVGADNSKYALKVFLSRFRDASMVSVAEKLEPFASISGLEACKRTVLTASRHIELIQAHRDLTYAILMPWLDGSTWQELLSEEEMSDERSLALGRSFARMMTSLEEKGLAHCDLSGPNVIIQPGDQPGLVDLEEMYGPGFLKPSILSAGSPGYAHQTARHGLWSKEADRFAGAVLLAEMLCWCDPAVREASRGESYFAPENTQKDNNRAEILRTALDTRYGERVITLFNQAWSSGSLRDCPTFAEWLAALPEKVREIERDEKIQIVENDGLVTLVLRAQSLADSGDMANALDLYRKAIARAPKKLRGEITERIATLEKRFQEEQTSSEKRSPARPCPDCGEEIPEEQEVCPHCEGVDLSETDPLKRTWWKYWGAWLGAGLIVVVLLAVLITRGGVTPTLPELTVTPLPTMTNSMVPSPTKTSTRVPSPTLTFVPTYTPSLTPDPRLGIISTQISPVDGMVLVYIPAGEFQMGSEEGNDNESPVHEVYLDAFWMDEHEVTLGQYQEFMATADYSVEARYFEEFCRGAGEDSPVACVNRYDASAYCEWAGKRLPTEAEWEKAARGGLEERIYPWGDQAPVCTKGAVNGAQFSSCGGKFVPVKSFSPNNYGLYDMAGNVGEWVSDWYDENYYQDYPVENPQGPGVGDYSVLRGGAFIDIKDLAYGVRVALRYKEVPSVMYFNVGFRCASSSEIP